jgi:hypothetical protein
MTGITIDDSSRIQMTFRPDGETYGVRVLADDGGKDAEVNLLRGNLVNLLARVLTNDDLAALVKLRTLDPHLPPGSQAQGGPVVR